METGYAELQVTSNFTFLRGGSHPEELVEQAMILGHQAIAITDRNTLAGVVRAYVAGKGKNIKVITACRLVLLDGPDLLAFPTDKAAYARLSRLLTVGNLRAEKGSCFLYKEDVYAHREGLLFIAVPPLHLNEQFEMDPGFCAALTEYHAVLGEALYLGMQRLYNGSDTKRMFLLQQLSDDTGVPLVATNDVHYHSPARRELQDVLTCVREKCTIYNAGYRLHQNAERYLKTGAEMLRLFANYKSAIRRTMEIANACQFSLEELKYIYPEEITSEGRSPMDELHYLTWKGAAERYPDGIPEKVRNAIHYEMKFVSEKDYAPYFLTVYDIVRYAREQKILCQGRGSAANSTICYCLGITSVDPSKFNLLFERFISSARNEPPDIDVDFEHERREEVIQYIYEKYGRDRAAIVATVTQVHQRGAVRDVAKAMGMSMDAINRLAASLWEFTDEWFDGRFITDHGFDAKDPHLIKILELTKQYIGFPRQLGQHTGGFVITRGKISDLCPVLNARMENRTCIEWNKDDIEALGFLKIDVLALGMLTCIRKAFDLAKLHYYKDFTLAAICPKGEEPERVKEIEEIKDPVYRMICEAKTIGVFQIESRAQQSMLPRLKPQCFYDLVIEVAIVRPGPIQGDMVHPYLRRREGKETPEYPKRKENGVEVEKSELEEILGRTLGVPLFQEQAMSIAITAADFSPTEADELRRSMATFKAKGKVTAFERKLISGMVNKGYEEDFAKRVFRQLEGFGSYGFPESHAVSFALLVYVSAWLKCYYPEVFATALLNSMPMGFYQPAQIIGEAAGEGVIFHPIDINASEWDNLMEETNSDRRSVRLGFRQIKGFKEEDAVSLLTGRNRPYKTITELIEAGVSLSAMERLADADAFRSLGMDRRQALWEVSALADRPVGLFQGHDSDSVFEPDISLPHMTDSEHVVQDYASTAFSLKAHPVSFVREELKLLRALSADEVNHAQEGRIVKVAGLVLVRQRPATASGVCFITIEDETGFANLVVFKDLFEKYRKEILRSRLLMVEGKVQREGKVLHIIVRRCFNVTGLLEQLGQPGQDDAVLLTPSRADEKDEYDSVAKSRKKPARTNLQAEIFPNGRNFH